MLCESVPSLSRLNDAFPDAWSAYGGVLLKVGRRGEALTALNKMMELRTNNPDLYCNVATYFEDLGEILWSLTSYAGFLAEPLSVVMCSLFTVTVVVI